VADSSTLRLTSTSHRAGRGSEAVADLKAGENVGEVRDRDHQEGNHASRRSEGWDPGVADEIFGGVRGGRRKVGGVWSRLDASCDGVEGFGRKEGDFGCGSAAGRPCLGGVEGVDGGLAVLGTDEDRSSWEVAVADLGEVVLG
jgi:hypothetical protein